jgi:hypothetical protein
MSGGNSWRPSNKPALMLPPTRMLMSRFYLRGVQMSVTGPRRDRGIPLESTTHIVWRPEGRVRRTTRPGRRAVWRTEAAAVTGLKFRAAVDGALYQRHSARAQRRPNLFRSPAFGLASSAERGGSLN